MKKRIQKDELSMYKGGKKMMLKRSESSSRRSHKGNPLMETAHTLIDLGKKLFGH